MASWVANNLTMNTSNGDKVCAITPAVDELLVVSCQNTGNITEPVVTDDQGGTYTMVAGPILKNGSADAMYLFVRDQLVASAVAHNVTMDITGGTTGGGLHVSRISGMTRTGADAVREVGGTPQVGEDENQAGATTPNPAFPAACDTANVTLTYVFHGTNSTTHITAPTGWTERWEAGYNTPATGFQMCSRNSGFTGTTVTWNGDVAQPYGAVVIELDSSAPSNPPVDLAATLNSTSTLAAAAEVEKPLEAVLASSSDLDGVLRDGKPLAAALASSSDLDGSLTDGKPLAAALGSQSAVTADLLDEVPLAATLASQSDTTAELTAGDGAVLLEAALASESSLAATFRVEKQLEATLASVSSVAAAIQDSKTLQSVLASVSSLSGSTLIAKPLAATLASGSSALGRLQVGIPAIIKKFRALLGVGR